jgi:hypothetical protein
MHYSPQHPQFALITTSNTHCECRRCRRLTRPRLMDIVQFYPLQENESGQIKENNYATHTTL